MLVEGDSDRAALHALAIRCGRDLGAEGVEVVAMGGITNIRACALHYGPPGLDARLAGLYDAPEEDVVRRGLAAAGLLTAPDCPALRERGFFSCTVDLEDELIRALGLDAVEALIEGAGEGRSLRLLTQMPAQREWTRLAVLRRFMGSQSGRKARYARLLTEALEPSQVPRPLADLLRWVEPEGTRAPAP